MITTGLKNRVRSYLVTSDKFNFQEQMSYILKYKNNLQLQL